MKMYFGNKYTPNITNYIPQEHFGYENFEDYWVRVLGLSKEELFAYFFTNESNNQIKENLSTDNTQFNDGEIEENLKKKEKESNISISILRCVMRRGLNAYNENHPIKITKEEWGYNRVNSFINEEKTLINGVDADLVGNIKK